MCNTWQRKHTLLGYQGHPRPAESGKRLALTSNGNIRYHLKTPYRDGITDVILDPAGALGGRPSAAERYREAGRPGLAGLVPSRAQIVRAFTGCSLGAAFRRIVSFVCG